MDLIWTVWVGRVTADLFMFTVEVYEFGVRGLIPAKICAAHIIAVVGLDAWGPREKTGLGGRRLVSAKVFIDSFVLGAGQLQVGVAFVAVESLVTFGQVPTVVLALKTFVETPSRYSHFLTRAATEGFSKRPPAEWARRIPTVRSAFFLDSPNVFLVPVTMVLIRLCLVTLFLAIRVVHLKSYRSRPE